MDFLVENWLAFLGGTGVLFITTVVLQLRNMKRGASDFFSGMGRVAGKSHHPEPSFDSFTNNTVNAVGEFGSRLKYVIALYIITICCGVVTGVGIIGALIEYFKTS